ncbi:MAG: DUF1573 domain-containing protein [Luteolibacter sp.]|uniref:DUF1573 domain-containing protein n=1 Tax=Luteolibacter sp. TaxID=1962973 RepID=UPI003262CEFE
MKQGLVFFLISIWLPARAEVVWEKPSQDFKKSPDDKELFVCYSFTNTGEKPVTIKSISSSCGCTTAELGKRTYLAGESGDLVATFVFGGRTGAQSKNITVLTDDQKKTVLSFNCMISDEPVVLTPSLVHWRVGEDPAGKQVGVTMAEKPAVKIVAVASSNPRIVADQPTAEEGGNYVIHIHPVDTTRTESAEIFVQTDYPPEGPVAYTIQVRVK